MLVRAGKILGQNLTFGCCPQSFIFFFKNLFDEKQSKYAMNIRVAQIRGALLKFLIGKKYYLMSLPDATFNF